MAAQDVHGRYIAQVRANIEEARRIHRRVLALARKKRDARRPADSR